MVRMAGKKEVKNRERIREGCGEAKTEQSFSQVWGKPSILCGSLGCPIGYFLSPLAFRVLWLINSLSAALWASICRKSHSSPPCTWAMARAPHLNLTVQSSLSSYFSCHLLGWALAVIWNSLQCCTQSLFIIFSAALHWSNALEMSKHCSIVPLFPSRQYPKIKMSRPRTDCSSLPSPALCVPLSSLYPAPRPQTSLMLLRASYCDAQWGWSFHSFSAQLPCF